MSTDATHLCGAHTLTGDLACHREPGHRGAHRGGFPAVEWTDTLEARPVTPRTAGWAREHVRRALAALDAAASPRRDRIAAARRELREADVILNADPTDAEEARHELAEVRRELWNEVAETRRKLSSAIHDSRTFEAAAERLSAEVGRLRGQVATLRTGLDMASLERDQRPERCGDQLTAPGHLEEHAHAVCDRGRGHDGPHAGFGWYVNALLTWPAPQPETVPF